VSPTAIAGMGCPFTSARTCPREVFADAAFVDVTFVAAAFVNVTFVEKDFMEVDASMGKEGNRIAIANDELNKLSC
jgi:hypothetical protein